MPAAGLKSLIAVAIFLSLPLLVTAEPTPPTLEQRLQSEPASELAKAALAEGDIVRGALIFHRSSITCVACHSVGDRPSDIGPDLTKLEPKTTDSALVESVLEPSKVIATAYAMVAVETAAGQTYRGIPVEDTAARLVLRDAAQPQNLIVLKPAEIIARKPETQSIMPTGQINLLADRRQFLDLVRYLIALRDGGAAKAREVERSLSTLVQEFPDKPLPYRPVVQRGEINVAGGKKYPRGVALGFVGGTVVFDADQLTPVALWQDGFLKSTPQNYFGVYMHSLGSPPQPLRADAHPLTVKLPGADAWHIFEQPLESDPNDGTRFDGYQIGRSAVRLHYRIRAGGQRIRVTEDIRVERQGAWQGLIRDLNFVDLPTGAQLSWKLPTGKAASQADSDGNQLPFTPDVRKAPWLTAQANDQQFATRIEADAGATWIADGPDQTAFRVISPAAGATKAFHLRLDSWRRSAPPIASKPVPIEPKELQQLRAAAPTFNDTFDTPVKPAAPVPAYVAADAPPQPPVPPRPGVNPKENSDEFPATTGRFLRFVITSTNDQSAPGLDELEIYGQDSKTNLALTGKATASSVISGYPIHQIKHLNDGKLGNPNSWISAENGGGWATIEFPEPVEMRKIVWARDRTGTCQDRLAVKYRIEISSNGQKWTKVGDEIGRAPVNVNAAGPLKRNASPGYILESLPLPFPGCRPSDILFADDGVMYLIAMTEGQIWRSRVPPAEHPDHVHWQRFASGLYHPIGLALVGNRLFVSQKPEITELIDRDGDGVVDQYRTFATGWGLSTGWHEYCFGLAADKQNNLWFALNTGYFWTNPGFVNPGRWRGSVMRASLETGRLEEVAKGCRVPNGIATGPDNQIFFTDNQGDWIQSCKLAHVVPGRFYGHPEYKNDALPTEQYPDGKSTIWFPYHRSRSTSGPVYDNTGGKFGPFAGQIFVGDVGYGANAGILRIALEKIDGEYQGACFPFVDGQPLGCERLRFGPDHNLYAASLTSGLTRLAYAGKSVPLAMQSVRIRPGGVGFVIHLTKPLAADQNVAAKKFAVKRFHYLYTGNYGSPQSDEKPIPVEAAELSADRTAITLSLPVETYPIGMVYELRLPDLKDGDGEKLLHKEAWYTVHKIPK